MEKDKQEFLNNEILTLCIIAGLSRGYPVCKKTGTNETSKKEFKKILLQKLRECEQFYKVKVSSEQHTKNTEERICG